MDCSKATSSSSLTAINDLCELKRPPPIKPKLVPKISSFSTAKLKPLIKPRSLSVAPVIRERETPLPENREFIVFQMYNYFTEILGYIILIIQIG